jgi:hypothetical protein
MHTMITEQDIQKTFFAHLREFYRYRFEYVPGSFEEATNALASGGIIADGMVSFQKPDGERFLCTFEATSTDKADEVKFRQNAIYFLWDCFAFASLFTGIGIAFMYFYKFASLAILGLTGMIGLVFTLFLFGFSFWYFLMPKWRKYRYIYAIEQFKQYFADEQWVVLGYDVFPNHDDQYLNELRTQCTFSGFGLAIIGFQGTVRVICTPSRLGIYGHDRADAHWVTGTTAYDELRNKWQKMATVPDGLTQLYNQIARPFRFFILDPITNILWRLTGGNVLQSDSEFNRYMKSYTHQKALSLIGLLMIGSLFYKTVRSNQFHTEVEYNTRSEYEKRRSYGYTNPEDQPGYVGQERLPITYGNGVPKQYPGPKPVAAKPSTTTKNQDGIESDESVQEIDLTALRQEDDTKVPKIEAPIQYAENTKSSTSGKGLASTKPIKTIAVSKPFDWCSTLNGKSGWLIQDNYFLAKDGAELRTKTLKAAGISCFQVQSSCLEKGRNGYYVFIKELFPSENSALDHLQKTISAIKKKNIETGRTIVRKWPVEK